MVNPAVEKQIFLAASPAGEPIPRLLPTSPSSQTTNIFGYPGASVTVSASSTSNGIVWVLDNSMLVGGARGGVANNSGPAILHAYRADDLSVELTIAVKRERATLRV